VRRLAVVAAAILLLAGCAPVATPLDPDTVALIPPQNAGMDALLVGAIHLGDDCVTVTTPESDDPILPVFPTSVVSWDGDSLVVEGTTYADGAVIWLSGGEVAEITDAMHLPEGCPTDTVWLVAG
jgi:hypothetical protein